MEKISILIVDDHRLIRETWAEVLNSDPRFTVVADCGDGNQAAELARKFRPQVVLMDINMSPVSGFEATEKIRKVSPASRVIGLSMYAQPAYAKKLMQLGARGYVTKNSSREEMVQAIVEVNRGEKFICEEIKNNISEQVLDEAREAPSVNSLTDRELQIIQQIKDGHSSREIAEQLNISLKTVEVHRHNILKKLRLKNSASLVNFINTSMTYI